MEKQYAIYQIVNIATLELQLMRNGINSSQEAEQIIEEEFDADCIIIEYFTRQLQ